MDFKFYTGTFMGNIGTIKTSEIMHYSNFSVILCVNCSCTEHILSIFNFLSLLLHAHMVPYRLLHIYIYTYKIMETRFALAERL